MSKERLEEIKMLWEQNNDVCFPDDYEWLIEQAEQVQELEKARKTLSDNHFQQIEQHKYLLQQNKRYREYLGRLQRATKRYPAEDMAYVVNKITSEALEGRGMKLIDLLIKHTKEVWYAGECECGESKYDLVTEPQAIYPPVHESTIRKVKPELLEESE